MRTSQHDPAALANRLSHDHRRFEREFDDLCRRAHSGDWRDLDEVWSAFGDELEAHLAFEENDLFPSFREQDAACGALADRLIGEHAEIRRLIESLGLQIQLKEIRPPTIEAFVELMRKHAAVENERLYPWLARAAAR